jgi:ER degradation enhancer, mannosidase alpha-like 2
MLICNTYAFVNACDVSVQSLRSIDSHLKRGPWYVDVNMNTGQVSWNVYNSLQGFWPGILAQIGRIREASMTMRAFHGVWRLYGCVPEGFNVFTGGAQEGQTG